VVEHDEEIMRSADYIIDMGPGAGTFGGDVVFQGPIKQLESARTITSDYLNGERSLPSYRLRKSTDKITVVGARGNNLQNVTVDFPLRSLVAVTGVSGSGKSTLVSEILYPAMKRHLGLGGDAPAEFDSLEGDIDTIKEIEYVDQNPIGKSSRSNPVTYIKAFDEIRAIFAAEALAKNRGYKPAFFSFNVPGGRCENCEGEGSVTIEMQFMADIKLECDVCKGKRYKDEILEVTYEGKNISEVLDMTVDEAIIFFSTGTKSIHKRLVDKLTPLKDVGLGYVGLGQSSSTLSGGEAQRIKLASFLAKGDRQRHTLFIFDEPTTGLHIHDVAKLLESFQALLSQGHSIILVEHQMDLVARADWVIDLGPGGGKHGGNLMFQGVPSQLTKVTGSSTGQFLAEIVK
ncbi:MAG: excinuclease ABC subunit A, partial [Bacteroidota bacterium]